MARTTVIRNAAWIAAWDPAQQRHVYIRDGDVAFTDGLLTQVGGTFAGDADAEIDGRRLFVMPGLVDVHCHATSQPLYKGIAEELGNPELWWSGLYDAKAVFTTDREGEPHSAAVAYAEMLLSGVTTFVDLSAPFDGWVDLLAASGARAYVAPMYGSAAWGFAGPSPFVRYGALLESFAAYRRAGLNMAIGTDTTPHDMLDEMRWACRLGKAADGNLDGVMTADVFEAATTGGARALGRDDIGRLSPGARADVVTVDLDRPSMRPARDPLRCLLFHGLARPIDAVYVDGRKVVDRGRVSGLDYDNALAGLEAVQQRSEAGVPACHWSGGGALDVAPLSLPVV